MNAQGRPLHCSGYNGYFFLTKISTTCEILNPSTQKYEPFPSLPIGAFVATNPQGIAVQLVRYCVRQQSDTVRLDASASADDDNMAGPCSRARAHALLNATKLHVLLPLNWVSRVQHLSAACRSPSPSTQYGPLGLKTSVPHADRARQRHPGREYQRCRARQRHQRSR